MKQDARVRLDRLRLGALIMLVGSLALIVDLVAFPWYSLQHVYSEGLTGLERNTIDQSPGAYFHILVPLAIICVMLAWGICIAQVAQRAPALPVAMTVIGTILDLILVIGLFIRVIFDQPRNTSLSSGANELKPDVASVAGLIFAIVLLFGAWRTLRTDGLVEADVPGRIETLRLAPRSR